MAQYDHLPEAYMADDGTPITAPVYRLIGPCYFCKPGGVPSYWEEGTELQTDLTPNDAMVPLNKAAAHRVETWLASLPAAGTKLTEEEIAEAAKLMAPRPGEAMPSHEEYWAGVIQLAHKIKAKKTDRYIPPVAQTVMPANRGEIPPMTAGDFKNVAHREDAPARSVHPRQAGRRVSRGVPEMSTLPKQPPADATRA